MQIIDTAVIRVTVGAVIKNAYKVIIGISDGL